MKKLNKIILKNIDAIKELMCKALCMAAMFSALWLMCGLFYIVDQIIF